MAKKAAYYISDEDRAREVTTPGGGGDKVRYFPYIVTWKPACTRC
jgi:hypothetical protein